VSDPAPPSAASSRDVFVSVVAPLHDDQRIVAGFARDVIELLRARYANYELVLVDDGSRDATPAVVEPLLRELECMRYVRLSRPFGEETAITAGMDSVIGEVVVVMLPNHDPVPLIPTFVDAVLRNAGIAFGVRRRRAGEGLLVRLGARIWYWYVERFLAVQLPRNSSQFRALSRAAVNGMVRIRDRHRYLRLLSADVGFPTSAIEYDPVIRDPRRHGRGFLERLGASLDIVVANTARPLRAVTVIGALAALANVGYALYVAGVWLFKPAGPTEGWTTTSLQMSLMFFLLFGILSVMGEYLGHLLVESRDRPLYHVAEERASPVTIASPARVNVVKDSVNA
jgi:glycosyltransferase involved in cell wall biosynthesis